MTPEMMNVFDPHCIFNTSYASGTALGAGNRLSTTRVTSSPAPKAFVGQTLGGSCSKRTPQSSTRNADPGAGLEAWAFAMPTSTGVCPEANEPWHCLPITYRTPARRHALGGGGCWEVGWDKDLALVTSHS